MGNIIWLASYPKSGNTWLRIFLANYLANDSEPVDINQLSFSWLAASREEFDEAVGIDSADLTLDEIDDYRPAYCDYLSQNVQPPYFIKVHDAYTYNRQSQPIFPLSATAGVIYLIRNPLDVVISYSHHSSWSVDRTIQQMNCPDLMINYKSNQLMSTLGQRLLTWSGHVQSWTEQTALPIQIIRYEDMINSPLEIFRQIIHFVGLDYEESRLRRALDFSALERLQAQEQSHLFREKAPNSSVFFRSGMIGEGRKVLTPEQRLTISGEHGKMMEKFGYLDNNDYLRNPD